MELNCVKKRMFGLNGQRQCISNAFHVILFIDSSMRVNNICYENATKIYDDNDDM